MQKLLTPQQYENSLDELNELRPLQLADEIQHKIDISICDKFPVSTKKAVTGLLTKGTQQGALLTKLVRDYTTYEVINQVFGYGDDEKLIEFAQKVFFVLCQYVSHTAGYDMYWTDRLFVLQIKSIALDPDTYLEFVGTDLYINAGVAFPGICVYNFYGFY